MLGVHMRFEECIAPAGHEGIVVFNDVFQNLFNHGASLPA
jgi:hypothetical protein